jgi:hypothetical protein
LRGGEWTWKRGEAEEEEEGVVWCGVEESRRGAGRGERLQRWWEWSHMVGTEDQAI